MTIKSVGFALKTDGKAQVKNDFAEVGQAGKEAMNEVASAAVEAGDRAAQAAETFADRQIAAWKRQANAAKAAAAGVDMRGGIDAALGAQGNNGQFATVNFDRSSGAARDSAAAIEAELKLEEDRAAALAKVRAALDPLAVAQQRYDSELRLYDSLLGETGLSEEEHAALVALSARRLRDAESALNGHSNALGLNRMQMVVGASAAHRFVDSILAGQSPMRAFMMQAGDVATVLQEDDGGVAGGLAKVRALITPTTVGVAALTAVLLAGTAAWYGYTDAVDKFDALAQGAGRVIGVTGDQLEANAESAAKAASISVSSARDIETSYVQLGGIGADVLGGLTALTVDFAAATGTDLKTAQQELGRAFQDPVKGAEDLTARYGFLTQAQIDHIQKLVEQNDLYGAQRALLQDLQAPLDNAADHVNGLATAWRSVKTAASEAWTWMGNAIDRALGGGTLTQQIADLQQQRQVQMARFGFGTTGALDAQIADLQKQLAAEKAKENTAAAKSKAVAAMGYVDGVTGDNSRDKLNAGKAAIDAMLKDGGKAAGLTAEQLQNARTAQDAYTHAVSTFLPEGKKQVELAQLEAQIAAAKGNPAKLAELNAQKSRVQNYGKLITAQQADAEATAAGTKAKLDASHAGAGHAATLAREAASMEVNARAALDVADAYLKSTAAGVQADAVRKASTDATKKGIDVQAQARRQLDLQVAEGAANGAKSVAQLRDETAARAAVNDNVRDGKLAVAGMNQALSDETALRPLLALQAISQGDAYKKLTEIIAAYKTALADAHAEEARSDVDQQVQSLSRQAEDAALKAKFAGDTSGAYERAKSQLDSKRFADDHPGTSDADRARLTGAGLAATNADLGASHAGSAAEALRSEKDQLAVYQTQLGALGKSADEQDRIVSRLQLQQQLARSLGDDYDQYAPAILAARDATDAANQKLKVAAASMDELKSFGEQLADDASRAKSWGDLWKSVINDVKEEMIKLIFLNPLKNLIEGDNKNATIGGVIKALGSLFGGAGHNATGTDYWSGGMTWVAENGPELVNLPRGSRVTNAADTRRMFAGNDNGRRGDTHYYDLRGAVVYEDLMKRIEASSQGAAAQGAAGGAKLARYSAQRSAVRKLGTR